MKISQSYKMPNLCWYFLYTLWLFDNYWFPTVYKISAFTEFPVLYNGFSVTTLYSMFLLIWNQQINQAIWNENDYEAFTVKKSLRENTVSYNLLLLINIVAKILFYKWHSLWIVHISVYNFYHLDSLKLCFNCVL